MRVSTGLLLVLAWLPATPARRHRKAQARSSLLGLTKNYSTFDLPFRKQPNLINIGKSICFRFFNEQNIFKHNLFVILYKNQAVVDAVGPIFSLILTSY